MARSLHHHVLVRILQTMSLGLSAQTVACVVPPPLGLDQPDAGADAAPILVSVRGPDGKELEQPGPITLVTVGQGDATITVYDSDPGDTMYVQGFVDYTSTLPTAPRSQCQAAPAADGSLVRTLTCTMRGLCDSGLADGRTHWLTFEVYDRMPSNDPLLYRSVPNGKSSQLDWNMKCLTSS